MNNLVRVYQPYQRVNGEMSPASINWSAIGTVDVAIARQFAEELLKACEEADTMNANMENYRGQY
jgi:hypothetical protein